MAEGVQDGRPDELELLKLSNASNEIMREAIVALEKLWNSPVAVLTVLRTAAAYYEMGFLPRHAIHDEARAMDSTASTLDKPGVIVRLPPPPQDQGERRDAIAAFLRTVGSIAYSDNDRETVRKRLSKWNGEAKAIDPRARREAIAQWKSGLASPEPKDAPSPEPKDG